MAIQTDRDPLLAGDRAPAPRTLLDVLEDVARRHPDAPALDDGSWVLSYRELLTEIRSRARELADLGLGSGDRVGVRATSGRADLYLSILGVLAAGAAYVPVDRDDPDERADLVFSEADVAAVIEDEGIVAVATRAPRRPARPGPDDDAWVIFTSGSTGKPKGVAVRHRNAAAFVDAEARLFLQAAPLGPGDRVLAGLSVAFDASCEEMWLAWGHGACLVPAPRSLVRAGLDLGPWVAAQRITVVSTVPTLAGLLPPDTLDRVRLLIFGGEACPPELAARLAVPGREVWNTYGPTEATVVACAALLDGEGPVRIGLPLDGWDLAVVGPDGTPVAEGETGELFIGGVGLARYLDPAKDAEKYAPAPTLGWERAYRSGDLVVRDPAGLLFVGRADDQVKVGGRRIELGEIDATLLELPGVVAAAAAVRRSDSGTSLLVGYVVPAAGEAFDARAATASLRRTLPAALVPLLAVVDEIPTRTSGKVDRDGLPWPLPAAAVGAAAARDGGDGADAAAESWTSASPTEAHVADVWQRVLGTAPTSADDDFFELGGGSLTAAQVVSALRARVPHLTVADLYDNPSVGDLAIWLDEHAPAGSPAGEGADPGTDPAHGTSGTAGLAGGTGRAPVRPVPRRAQAVQVAVVVLVRTLAGLRWLTWLAAVDTVLAATTSLGWVRPVSWWWVAAGWVVLVSPPGRMLLSVAAARLLLRGVRAGDHPRGGSVHLRIWAVEQLVGSAGAVTAAGAPLVGLYARLLGAKVGRGVDLHALPPVTGLLTLGRGSAVEPEVDLSGYWVEGDVVHVGHVHVGAGATVGARSTLLPGARVGAGADVAAGSAVWGEVGPDEYWAGSPAVRVRAETHHPWPDERPPRSRGWALAYVLGGIGLSLLPVVSVAVGLLVLVAGAGWLGDLDGSATTGAIDSAVRHELLTLALWVPVAALVAFFVHAVLVWALVRTLGLLVHEGYHPAESATGWAAWATERLMDHARTVLFPIYCSVVTPVWLRLLGARVGRDVEISTVVGIPAMMDIAHGAFLADDTMVAPYELGGGWVRVARARVGKRAFLGNSGITAPGRSVPKNGLVAVLSAAPTKAKAGTSWLGSPPTRLRRVVQSDVDEGLTFAPPRRLVVARGLVEACRLLAPITAAYLATLALVVVQRVVSTVGWGWAALTTGVVLLAVGVLGASVTALAKWVLAGRVGEHDHPLWSGFVWRGELADTFTETVAAPWFADRVAGSPLMSGWLRLMGARVGRGVWCETYWLPEADLVTLGDGATVGRGCVVQTHLFHDRVMSLSRVELEPGATLGPHGVVLPAARIERGASVGPGSLVMRGEVVPAGTRWRGNPIAAWTDGPVLPPRP
ncbi:Pls/PosA family non-ribosomal peptide synthetase [Luteimicrobium subarcticum]|uniref:Non-ribosomal peptide synthetase-like protein n=1 Tax=Luteimicrobium subarcticum TaxID=620910 RepID=A0A2M8WJ81_9MICO|nr:Pls/PosA family non-ribosomal peptide synthetase [Luteimicrobium subarcticum]PJI90982.1 non-ribosomal peptide synthetase-like protein [Luteimicrobium subarcticum]